VAGLVAPTTLEQIRAASDIVDVIGAVLPLKRAGANFVTLCPFHREKSPSFNVNPHRQIFHCFGCHKGGDVFTFITEYESLSFIEAVRRLAERARIPLEFETGSGQQEANYQKEKLLQIHEQIAQRWQAMLTNDANGQIARDYLTKRGVSQEAVQLFRLGYSPEQWDDTVNWAASKNYDLPLMEQSGLVLRKEDSSRYYDRFRGRLMFPICDEQGRIIGFSGRVLQSEDQGAKYVNSPETAIFKKGRVFYGLDKSKRAILDSGFAVVCEGQLDLIACFMAGVKNVVAPQGTAFTPEHARILKRYVDEVVLCFDADSAGQKAAVRVEESLLASGLGIRVATMPAPHDPDSYIKEHGGEGFQRLIGEAREFFDFYLDHLCATNSPETEKGQIAVVRQMAAMVNKTGDRVLTDKYAQKTAFKLATFMQLPVSPEAVRVEFKKVKPGRATEIRAPDADEQEPVAAEEIRPSEREFWLLRFLLAGDDHIDWVARILDPGWIEHQQVRQIVVKRIEAHTADSWRGIPGLLAECDSAPAQQLITRAVAEPPNNEALAKNLLETVLRVRNDFIERELKLLTVRRSQPGLSDEDGIQLETRKNELRKLKAQPITEDPTIT
jgi:DNA primase catalytic core